MIGMDSKLETPEAGTGFATSVHTLETTVDFAPTEPESATEATSLAQKQSRIAKLYEHFDYCPEYSRASRLKGCRTFGSFYRHRDTGEVMRIRPSCKLRWCVKCSSARSSWASHSTSEWLRTLHRPKLVTVTQRHSNAELPWQIQCITEHYRNLRLQKNFKKYVRGGVWFFQTKFSKPTGQWHNHIHNLLDSDYYPHPELKKNWSRASGGSYIVDIQPIRHPQSAANEAARYVSSCLDVTEHTDDQLYKVAKAVHGKRLCGTFGSAKGVPLKPPKMSDWKLWEDIGSIALVEFRRDSDPAARAILKAEHFHTSLAAGVTVTYPDNMMDNFNAKYPVRFGGLYGS